MGAQRKSVRGLHGSGFRFDRPQRPAARAGGESVRGVRRRLHGLHDGPRGDTAQPCRCPGAGRRNRAGRLAWLGRDAHRARRHPRALGRRHSARERRKSAGVRRAARVRSPERSRQRPFRLLAPRRTVPATLGGADERRRRRSQLRDHGATRPVSRPEFRCRAAADREPPLGRERSALRDSVRPRRRRHHRAARTAHGGDERLAGHSSQHAAHERMVCAARQQHRADGRLQRRHGAVGVSGRWHVAGEHRCGLLARRRHRRAAHARVVGPRHRRASGMAEQCGNGAGAARCAGAHTAGAGTAEQQLCER